MCPIIKLVCLKKTAVNEVDNRSHDDKRASTQTSSEYDAFVSLRDSIIWTSTFPCGSAGKESAWNVGDLGLIPGLGRSFRGGKGYPLQYSGPENSKDYIVHRVAKSWTGLSDFHFHCHSEWKWRKLDNIKML